MTIRQERNYDITIRRPIAPVIVFRLSAPELSAPSWSLKVLTSQMTLNCLRNTDTNIKEITAITLKNYNFYRRKKIDIKCVIRTTVSLSAPRQEQLPFG